LSSSDTYNVRVSFHEQVFGMRLQLINGNLETVHDEINHFLELRLPGGIYQLKIFYLDYYQEEFFSVNADMNLLLDFNYPLTIPVLGFRTTHEYYSEDAVHYSLVCTENDQPGPNFLFFAALRDMDKPSAETPGQWLKSYSIFNIDRTKEIQFTEKNTTFEDAVGKVYFSTFLEPGLYFLSYDNKEHSRIFPLYIFDDYQTQFFIRYDLQPDFKNCRFFFSKEKNFSETGVEYFVLEKILYAFANFKHFDLITSEDINVIRHHPYLVTLVNILFSTLNKDTPGEAHKPPLVSPVQDNEQLELPDIHFCGTKDAYSLSDTPPLLSFIMARHTRQLGTATMTFKPASILDQIVDNIKCDLFWNNFSRIDKPGSWENIYMPVLQKMDEPRNIFARAFRTAKNAITNYQDPKVAENLGLLLGNTKMEEGHLNSFNDTLGKIKGVSDMSKTFGLPLTTILRHYDTYHSYYVEITEPGSSGTNPGSRRIRVIIISGTLALLAVGAFFKFSGSDDSLTSTTTEIAANITTSGKETMPADDMLRFKPDEEITNAKRSADTTVKLKISPRPKKITVPAIGPPDDIVKANIPVDNQDNDKTVGVIASAPPSSQQELKDTLARFEYLVKLLDANNSLNVQLRNDSSNRYQNTKKLWEINSLLLDVVKTEGSYLMPNLTESEVMTMQNYFENWQNALEPEQPSNRASAQASREKTMMKRKSAVRPVIRIKPGHLTPLPPKLRERIDNAYEELKRKVQD